MANAPSRQFCSPVSMRNRTSGTTVTQTIPLGTFVNAGQTDIRSSGIGSITLAAGAITRAVGKTADFVATGPSTMFVTTSTGVTNNLLGAGPAFFTTGDGATWATVSCEAIAGLSTYGTNTYSSSTNTDVTVSAAPATCRQTMRPASQTGPRRSPGKNLLMLVSFPQRNIFDSQ